MKKLSKMAADANAVTSPSQDSNVWQGMMTALAIGLRTQYDVETAKGAMNIIVRALEDGLNEQSKRAMKLAARIQDSLNNLDKKGGEGGNSVFTTKCVESRIPSLLRETMLKRFGPPRTSSLNNGGWTLKPSTPGLRNCHE